MEKQAEGYTYKYPHPAVATDCVVFGFDGKELKVLLIERGLEPYKGMWAFPGGFMRMDETAEEGALRELKEETGLEITQIRQLGTFTGVKRDPRERVISIAFYALSRHAAVEGGDDAARAKWWAIDEVPQLAFDHDYILRQAMKRIRQDIHFEPVGFGLLDEQFTIAELQRLYESILGIRFDRRNFYRKMLQTGILQEVEEDETPKTTFFGKHNEMKQMDIDNLFGNAEKQEAPLPSLPIKQSANFFILPDDTDYEKGDEEAETETSTTQDRAERVKKLYELLQNSPADSSQKPQPAERSHTVGRKGKLFRFDQENYKRMKEDGNFRLEF